MTLADLFDEEPMWSQLMWSQLLFGPSLAIVFPDPPCLPPVESG